ncbi:MAG: porin family protein [Chlorobi bacterium]|nr:porin family protein [Chlorobiota bacterium]
MKRSIAIYVILILLIPIAGAQTGKGSFLIATTTDLSNSMAGLTGGGSGNSAGIALRTSFINTSADSQNSVKEKTTFLNFTPRVGYFISNRLVIGLDLTLWTSKQSYSSGDYKSIMTLTAYGPFVRFYFSGEKKVVPFLEAKGSVGSWKTKSSFGANTYRGKNSIISWSGGAGLAFYISDKISIDILAGYESLISKEKDSQDSSSSHNNTLGLAFGFTLVF